MSFGSEEARAAIARAAEQNLPWLDALPLSPDVKRLTALEMERILAAPAALFVPGTPICREYEAVANLRRFVAGQLHWEVSGMPKSYLSKMAWRDALRTLRVIRRAGGWKPWFEAHIPSRGAGFLLPAEYARCYERMAQTIELQPEIRGILGGSWLHAEETMAISPHLEWLNRLFLDNGGILVHAGPAAENSGFLVGSPKRREMYEKGTYRPRHGLFLWPRQALIDWVRRHAPASN